MIELIVECWRDPGGSERFMASVWADGRRIYMGKPHADADAAERDGRTFCADRLRFEPDRVTRL